MDEYAEANYDKYPLAEYHLWGPRDYFKGEFYSNASCYFTSESGYHALNNVESLKKFIKEPWPLFVTHSDNKDDYLPWGGTMLCTKEYLAHATSVIDDYNSQYNYRIRLLTSQVFTLFKDDIDNLEDFVLASQISQAEAKKYFIERMRKDYDRNGGIIWWNLIDGWPQVSDAIVDYYFSKKLAYDYIKKSQTPTLLMMNEDKGDKLNLYVVSSENKEHHIKYEVVDAYKNEVLLKDEAVSIPHSSRILREIEADEKTLLIIKYIDESGNEYINHFHTHIKDLDFNKYIETMKKHKLINR